MDKAIAQRLANIRRFDQLISFLRDPLEWPIESDDFTEITFDYTAEELGIDTKNAAKIEKIMQLRPLVANQPWGIFFVMFEPKKLPVVALRRILSQITVKKRKSASAADRKAWSVDDLLFISNYGDEESGRQISFAHFSVPTERTGLPTLKVLGWSSENTAFRLDSIARELTEHLAWPDDERDVGQWRKQWRGAFSLGHREVITTAERLSIRLAELAGAIRDRIRSAIAIESPKGPLTTLMKAFQESLMHDLNAETFADMYAQTISYGLLSARIADPTKKTADDFAAHMRTSPFLRELMQTFLKVGGRQGNASGIGIDFDELGVADVVQLLDDANMEAVLRDFGDRNRQQDPVMHFFEGFLQAYDKKIRKDRGVFYTPQPVVSYIVRSVHEVIQTEFGLEDGLASTITWGEMLKKHPNLILPPLTDQFDETRTISPAEPFVQILDPATGTATFLVEVIDVIHRTLLAKWKQQRLTNAQQLDAWNEYVPNHLLPRLHAYELMMAPYAIAHMKIGLKLAETGYRFATEERARIYLTNALEPWVKQLPLIGFDALAQEAAAVNEIKRHKRFTVVIGNPPYSRVSQNQSAFTQRLMKDYKEPVANEANQQPLDDDYIKCLRLAHYLQATSKCGVIGFITNHTVISGILFRGVRQRLLEDQNLVAVVDLHGNSNIKEKCPDGTKDENVFDIQAGVAITIGAKGPWLVPHRCVFHELWGLRDAKYAALERLSVSKVSHTLAPTAPYFFLKPIDLSAGEELKGAFALPDIFTSYSSGLMTVRDNLAISFDREELRKRFELFRSSDLSDEQFQSVCPVKDYRKWTISIARQNVRADKKWETRIEVVNYRPFDKRWIFYSPDIITYPNFRVMDQFKRKNLGLISSRIHKGEEHAHEFATRDMVEIIFLSSKSSNNAFLFPLYTFESDGKLALEEGGVPNLSKPFLKQLATTLGLRLQPGSGLPSGLTPEDIFHYAYAVLHSPGYRGRYAELLKIDFPRLPLTGNLELFRTLTRLGGELTSLHLLESPKLDQPITDYIGDRAPVVEKVSWTKNTVWLDKAQTVGFKGVREDVWKFQVGGYQVCEKWLKDRKGRPLSKDDIAHYQKVVVALAETIRQMKEIDEVIEEHGGWPGAFQASAYPKEEAMPLL